VPLTVDCAKIDVGSSKDAALIAAATTAPATSRAFSPGRNTRLVLRLEAPDLNRPVDVRGAPRQAGRGGTPKGRRQPPGGFASTTP
jgi:hypothetical protein